METKDLKISEQTQQLIACLEAKHRLWDQLRKTLVFIYGENQAGSIMENEYNKVDDQLGSVLSGLVMESIKDSMLESDYRKI